MAKVFVGNEPNLPVFTGEDGNLNVKTANETKEILGLDNTRILTIPFPLTVTTGYVVGLIELTEVGVSNGQIFSGEGILTRINYNGAPITKFSLDIQDPYGNTYVPAGQYLVEGSTNTRIKLCSFKYNNKYYGGFTFISSRSSWQSCELISNTGFPIEPFIVAYKNDHSGEIVNEEIGNSLNTNFLHSYLNISYNNDVLYPAFQNWGYFKQGKELPYTWEEISTKTKAGNFYGINIGDYKTITLTTGEVVVMEVAGIDTYYRSGSTANQVGHHIDFISRDCLSTLYYWTTKTHNNGTAEHPNPWLASDLYQSLNNETDGVITTLPEDLKPYIIPKIANLIKRYSSEGILEENNQTDGSYWGDLGKLWTLSVIEVNGSDFFNNNDNLGRYMSNYLNKQYPIFLSSYNHIRKNVGANGSTISHYFTCEVHGSSSTTVIVTSQTGVNTWRSLTDKSRVPLCFRIG